jgi:hypothetical protein
MEQAAAAAVAAAAAQAAQPPTPNQGGQMPNAEFCKMQHFILLFKPFFFSPIYLIL